MKLTQLVLSLIVALYGAVVHAETVPILDNSLGNVSVFANTYVTTGANSIVIGNILSGGVATTGANSSVSNNIISVGAVTIGGGSSSVGGNVISGGVSTIGNASVVGGYLTSLGAGTIGANSKVIGNMVSDGVGTLGDTSSVGGYLWTGGAATVGANASVAGKIEALGAITLSASSKTNGTGTLSSMPVLTGVPSNVLHESQQIGTAQAALNTMVPGTALPTTMTIDTTLYPGVFSAANLSTTAGITLTLDGQNKSNQSWVFNIDDYFVTGASTKIVVINANASDSVIWNSGGYASLGASTTFIGTILAKDYVSIGANANVTGIGDSCGGVFSASSYVSTGDGARIGGNGCSGIGSGFNIVDGTAVYGSTIPAIPEPSIYWMLAAGLFVFCLIRYRERQVVLAS
ncbi:MULTISPECIES: ice-binding family protein [unclassified Janthinobacterium]|uniref:ice-binding family protein n=1 Tax=unclassified Janthinobacterium TaxID=2610881 RepID=UPI00160892DA|nr:MULTISPECIES: ice-binding family protein [unclassified Janthinobacterium]MBB5606973.1 hypothetical protein [Janthinobacterium sp. S3T4]MBB5612699.1 hypothetical protein [Janthinobacterium sp. S3M3]